MVVYLEPPIKMGEIAEARKSPQSRIEDIVFRMLRHQPRFSADSSANLAWESSTPPR
jgi:hypothetical protein